MEPGHCQGAEDICFSDVQPLSIGTWKNYNHDHLGRLTGTCVWTVQPPDGILPGNLPHPHQQHEPSEVVHPHCLSFRSYIVKCPSWCISYCLLLLFCWIFSHLLLSILGFRWSIILKWVTVASIALTIVWCNMMILDTMTHIANRAVYKLTIAWSTVHLNQMDRKSQTKMCKGTIISTSKGFVYNGKQI